MIYVAILLVVALVPGLVLRHVDAYLSRVLPARRAELGGADHHQRFRLVEPGQIMLIVGVIFMLLFAWLLFVNRRAQKVKQFNIVFSAERPYRPRPPTTPGTSSRHIARPWVS
jgi:hypothetical protein